MLFVSFLKQLQFLNNKKENHKMHDSRQGPGVRYMVYASARARQTNGGIALHDLYYTVMIITRQTYLAYLTVSGLTRPHQLPK